MSNSLLLHLGASIYQKYRSTLDIVDPFGDNSGVALYKFDGDAQDVGGLYNGTATNVTYSLGKFNSSTQHVADWVVVANSNNISSGVSIPSNFLTNKTALTISMWVYSQDTTQPTILTGFDYRGSRLFCCSIIKSSTTDYFGLSVKFPASSIMLWSGGNNNSDHVLFSSYAMPLNQWVHFTLVFSGASTSWKVYANSVLVATFTHETFTITGTSNVLDRTYFGCSGYTQISSGDKYDQVRIFNRALTSTEVTAIYDESVKTYVPYVPPQGFFNDGTEIAHYTFDGDVLDSVNNYDGTASNLTYGTGKFGDCGVFNGSNTLIDTGIPQSALIVSSFSVWVYPLSGSNYKGVFGDHYSNTSGICGFQYVGGQCIFGYGNSSTTGCSYGITLALNTWTHLVGIITGTGLQIYKNGLLEKSVSGGALTPMGNLLVGRTFPLADRYWNGSIDQFRIFNRALTQEEVTSLYMEE